MTRWWHQRPTQEIEHTMKEYLTAHQALLDKVLPLYQTLKDPAQQALFVSGMLPPRGPYPFTDSHQGQGLYITDFPGMTNEQFNQYVQLAFDPVTGSVGGLPPGPNAIPYADLLKLVIQAQAMHGV